MPYNAFSSPDQFQTIGAVAMINDTNNPQNIAQAVATGSAVIVVPPGAVEVVLTAGAATTGASLPAGSFDGQLLFVTITTAAANTVTFAAVGTSKVAGGAAVSLAGLATHLLRWSVLGGGLWFQVGPLTN